MKLIVEETLFSYLVFLKGLFMYLKSHLSSRPHPFVQRDKFFVLEASVIAYSAISSIGAIGAIGTGPPKHLDLIYFFAIYLL